MVALSNIIDSNGKALRFLNALNKAITNVTTKRLRNLGGSISTKSDIGKSLNASMSTIGRLIDEGASLSDEVLDVIASDELLSALVVAHRLGNKTDDLIEKLLNFKCNKSTCHALKQIIEENADITDTAGALKKFYAELSEMLQMVDDGLMSNEAYASFAKVLEGLGSSGIHVQRGAAHVVMATRKLIDKLGDPAGKIVKFEARTPVGPGGKYGARIYDIEIQQGSKIFRIELKAWDPAKFKEYMKTSLTGLGRVSDKTDVVPNQMSKDLIDSLNKVGLKPDGDDIALLSPEALDAIDVRWIFDGRTTANAGDLADEVIDILTENPTLAQGLLRRVTGFAESEDVSNALIDNFLKSDELKTVLMKIFEIPSA